MIRDEHYFAVFVWNYLSHSSNGVVFDFMVSSFVIRQGGVTPAFVQLII